MHISSPGGHLEKKESSHHHLIEKKKNYPGHGLDVEESRSKIWPT